MLLSPLKEETLIDLTEQKSSRDFCSSASNSDGNINITLFSYQFKGAQNSLKRRGTSNKQKDHLDLHLWLSLLSNNLVKKCSSHHPWLSLFKLFKFKPPSLVVTPCWLTLPNCFATGSQHTWRGQRALFQIATVSILARDHTQSICVSILARAFVCCGGLVKHMHSFYLHTESVHHIIFCKRLCTNVKNQIPLYAVIK